MWKGIVSRRRKLILFALPAIILLAVWLYYNRPMRFGWCRFAYTTFNAIPRPITDFQVAANGSLRYLSKTHDLQLSHMDWLLKSDPDILIIATGWDGVVRPRGEIMQISTCELHVLTNDKAIVMYNQLKSKGRRVAIHYHSTC